jgi:hypothetical protein
VLEVKGNFATGTSNYQSYRATGAHITRFSGAGAQSMAFSYPATGQSQFANLEVTGGGTLSVNTSAFVAGTMTVTGGSTVSGNNTMYIASVLSATAGTSLAGLNHIDIYGAGAVFPQLAAGTGPPLVQFTSGGVVTAPSNLTLPTSLNVINGSTLDVAGTALTISGNLSWNAGGYVRMTNPAGSLLVTGDLYANNVDLADVTLTAGVLEVKGNFATGTSNYQSYRATGVHITRFSGTGAQAISFSYPATGNSQFANLEVTGGGTLSVNTSTFVAGTMTVTGGSVIGGGNTMYIAGLLSATAGTSLAGLNHIDIYGAGAVFPQLAAGTGPPLVQFTSGGVVTAPSNLTLPTSLNVINGSTLDVAGTALTISGNLSWNAGGYVRMTNPAGSLLVTGDFYANNVDLGDVTLTAGVLEVKGNFATGTSNYQSYRATGAHITRFSGTGAQSMALTYPAAGQSQFANVEITNASGGGVSPTSTITIAGGFNQLGRFSILSQTVNVGGAVTLGPSSITTVSGGFTKASCSILPGLPGASFSGFSCP